jgi:anti-sigma regulatory factor (Ser/Thr protein kinase)
VGASGRQAAVKIVLGFALLAAVAGYLAFRRFSRRLDRIRRSEDARKAAFQKRLIEGGLNAELDYIVAQLDREIEEHAPRGAAPAEPRAERIRELRAVLLKNRDHEPVPFDVETAVAKEIASWTSQNIHGTIEHVPLGESFDVRGSEELFRWAVGELISNTLAHGAGWSRIVLRLERGADDEIVLSFSDDGDGPDVMEVARLYGAFTPRVDSAGPGLGLFAIRSIVERMRGSISASPGEGGGLTHTIRLPRRAEVRSDLPSIARIAAGYAEGGRPSA